MVQCNHDYKFACKNEIFDIKDGGDVGTKEVVVNVCYNCGSAKAKIGKEKIKTSNL